MLSCRLFVLPPVPVGTNNSVCSRAVHVQELQVMIGVSALFVAVD